MKWFLIMWLFAQEARATKIINQYPSERCETSADCEVFFHGPCFRWVAVKRSLRQQISKSLDAAAMKMSCSDSKPMGKKPKVVCKVLSVGDCGPNQKQFGIPCAAQPFPTCQKNQ